MWTIWLFPTVILTASALFSAKAHAETQFTKFDVKCANGAVCAVDIPVPVGTASTYALTGLSCGWVADNVTRIDIEYVAKSNGAQQFVIPWLLSDEERALKWYTSLGRLQQFRVKLRAVKVLVKFRSSVSSSVAATCFAAF